MRIRWYGHSCFLLTDDSGLRILTDPFDDSIGYPTPAIMADHVTVSHSHFDHAAVGRLPGAPRVLQNAGTYRLTETLIRGIPAFHDDQNGKRRGPNLMFHITMDEVRVLHCGDLGHLLQPQQLLQTGPVDILLVPVGGSLTLGPEEAWKLCQQIKPRVIVPMHYKTPALSFPLATVDEFTSLFPGEKTVQKESVIEIYSDGLPLEQEVWVLNYQ